MKTPTVVSVINLKGGVGKTTVTALLARYAATEWVMNKSLENFRANNHGSQIDVCGVVVHRTKTSGAPDSKDGRDSLDDIKRQAGEYGWDVLENIMDHSDAYPRMAKDLYPGHLGNANAPHEWPKVAEEILAKIGLRKKEANQ